MTEDERRIRRECATIAASEYERWKNLPERNPHEPEFLAMQIAAMEAASNICVAIMLDKKVEDFHQATILDNPGIWRALVGDSRQSPADLEKSL